MPGRLLMSATGGEVVIPGVDLTDGLVAHYLLNNNADDSFGSFDGTAIGGVDFQGDSAKFDEIDDKIITGVTDSGATSTSSLWFKGTGTSKMIARSTYNKTLNHGTQIYLSSTGHVSIYRTDTTIWTVELHSTTVINDNLLHHILYTASPSGTLLYIDGVLEASTTDTVSPSTSLVWELGHNLDNLWLNGELSNFRAYNDSKDQAFITALFEEGYYPKPLPLPTTDGLIAHYPLTGTAEDSTGNYDGTENGNIYVDDAEFGSVADFDGTNDYITLPDGLSGYDFANDTTFHLWIKVSTINTDKYIFQTLSNDSLYNFNIRLVNDKIRAYTKASTNQNYSDTDSFASTDTWYSLTILWDSSENEFIFYIDGTLINSTQIIDDTISTVVSDGTCRVGSNTSGTLKFLGNMSNVRIYNKALTSTEITDIYNYEKNFRSIDIDDGLVTYYPLTKNSLDNYYNEYDGVDTAMTYDGLSGVFNGSTSWIDTLVAHTQELTVSVFAKMNVSNVPMKLFTFYSTSTGHQVSVDTLDTGILRLISYDGVSSNEITFSFSIDTWYHIVIIGDGVTLRLFIDNVEIGTPYTYSDLIVNTSLEIGRIDYGTNFNLDGNLAKFRVYNKAITVEQLEVLYNTEKGDFI